jgi:hypothetical protein
MPNTFEILAGFLERFGEEVEGREAPLLPSEIEGKMRELAGGNLPAAEQAQLFKLLNENPQWISNLAKQVKALRSPPAQPKG